MQENRKKLLPAHQSHRRLLILLISLCLIRITSRHSGGTTFSLFFNRFYHIQDNVQLGWGKSWGRKFLLLMLSYFGNLVAFCLILKFFKFLILLSMVIKEKNFKMKWEELNFYLFTWNLEFVLCLLQLMNYWTPIDFNLISSTLSLSHTVHTRFRL